MATNSEDPSVRGTTQHGNYAEQAWDQEVRHIQLQHSGGTDKQQRVLLQASEKAGRRVEGSQTPASRQRAIAMRSRQQPGQGAVSPGVQKSAQITSAKFGDQAHGWGAVRPLSPCAELPGHLAALYTNLFQVPPRVASPAVRSTSRAASPMPCQVASRRSASRAGPPNLPSWAPSQENQAPNDDEHMMDAYIAEFKRRKSMPAAATVIAASWRAYRPRQLYLRFKAMRARNAAATIAPYFAAWARQRLVSRHPRLAAQARIFRHWLEITRLTKELYLRVTKGLQAAFAKTNMGALMLWRLCKAASEAGGAPASMRLSSALIIVMQRRYPLRIMQTAFEHWRAKRAFLARRRLHAISHLTHALGCWPITTLRPAFRFWYQYTMILKAGRAGQPLPLFPAQESADWESWRWAHEHRLKRKQHVIALHQVTRLQRCFLALRARAVLGKAMRQAWARATRHHVDLLKRLALRALQQNRKRRAVLRRVKGAIFQAWQQVTARHLQLRGIIIKLQAVSARSARRDAFTRWRLCHRAHKVLAAAASIRLWRASATALPAMHAWRGDLAHMWQLLCWWAWRSWAARRLRFRNLISLHLSMPNLYLMKATFVGWRLVAATPHARKALVSLHVTELPVWPPPYLGSTRSSRRQSATGVLQNNEHLMAAKIQKMMMVDITSDKGPLLALPPAPLVVESDTDWLKTSQHVMSLTWRSAPCDIPLWQMATASLRKHHRTGRAAWQHQPKAGIAVDEQIAGFHEALCRAEGLLEQVALQAAQLTPGSSDAEAFWNALWRAGLSTSKFVGDLLVVLLHRTVLHDMACARARLRFRLERDKWLQDRQQYLAITQAMARNPSLLGNLEKTMCGPETHQGWTYVNSSSSESEDVASDVGEVLDPFATALAFGQRWRRAAARSARAKRAKRAQEDLSALLQSFADKPTAPAAAAQPSQTPPETQPSLKDNATALAFAQLLHAGSLQKTHTLSPQLTNMHSLFSHFVLERRDSISSLQSDGSGGVPGSDSEDGEEPAADLHRVISQQLSILFTPEADDIDLIDTFASGHLADYAQLSPGAEVSTELGRRVTLTGHDLAVVLDTHSSMHMPLHRRQEFLLDPPPKSPTPGGQPPAHATSRHSTDDQSDDASEPAGQSGVEGIPGERQGGKQRKQRPPRSAVFKRLYEVPEEGQAKRQARLAREKELREALQYTADQQQRMAQEAERIRLKAHSAYRSVAPHTTGGGGGARPGSPGREAPPSIVGAERPQSAPTASERAPGPLDPTRASSPKSRSRPSSSVDGNLLQPVNRRAAKQNLSSDASLIPRPASHHGAPRLGDRSQPARDATTRPSITPTPEHGADQMQHKRPQQASASHRRAVSLPNPAAPGSLAQAVPRQANCDSQYWHARSQSLSGGTAASSPSQKAHTQAMRASDPSHGQSPSKAGSAAAPPAAHGSQHGHGQPRSMSGSPASAPPARSKPPVVPTAPMVRPSSPGERLQAVQSRRRPQSAQVGTVAQQSSSQRTLQRMRSLQPHPEPPPPGTAAIEMLAGQQRPGAVEGEASLGIKADDAGKLATDAHPGADGLHIETDIDAGGVDCDAGDGTCQQPETCLGGFPSGLVCPDDSQPLPPIAEAAQQSGARPVPHPPGIEVSFDLADSAAGSGWRAGTSDSFPDIGAKSGSRQSSLAAAGSGAMPTSIPRLQSTFSLAESMVEFANKLDSRLHGQASELAPSPTAANPWLQGGMQGSESGPGGASDPALQQIVANPASGATNAAAGGGSVMQAGSGRQKQRDANLSTTQAGSVRHTLRCAGGRTGPAGLVVAALDLAEMEQNMRIWCSDAPPTSRDTASMAPGPTLQQQQVQQQRHGEQQHSQSRVVSPLLGKRSTDSRPSSRCSSRLSTQQSLPVQPHQRRISFSADLPTLRSSSLQPMEDSWPHSSVSSLPSLSSTANCGLPALGSTSIMSHGAGVPSALAAQPMPLSAGRRTSSSSDWFPEFAAPPADGVDAAPVPWLDLAGKLSAGGTHPDDDTASMQSSILPHTAERRASADRPRQTADMSAMRHILPHMYTIPCGMAMAISVRPHQPVWDGKGGRPGDRVRPRTCEPPVMPGEHGSRARRASTAEPALSALTKRLRPIAHHAPAGSPSPDNLQAVDSIEQPAAKPTVPADLLPELVERRSTALAEDRQDGYAQLNDEQLEAVEADAQYLADMTLEAHQDELATRRAADTSKAAPGGNGHGLQLAGWPPPPADQHAQQFHTVYSNSRSLPSSRRASPVPQPSRAQNATRVAPPPFEQEGYHSRARSARGPVKSASQQPHTRKASPGQPARAPSPMASSSSRAQSPEARVRQMLEGFDPFDMRTPLKLRGQDRAHSPIRPISPPGVPDWLDPNTSLKVLRPHTAEVHARMPKVVQLGVSKPQEKVRCPDVHRVPPTMRDYMEAFD